MRKDIDELYTEKKESMGRDSRLQTYFAIFAFLTIGGLALSLTSLSSTGYVVSDLSQSTPGIFGAVLFFVGIVGMFFSLRG